MNNLINASKEGDLPKVKYYLSQKNINVNETDNDGYTALMYAAENGYLDVVKELITHKADINIANDGWTALIAAVFKGHLNIVKELIAHKADLNKSDSTGSTPLIFAAHIGHLDIVKKLIAHKAEINKVSNNAYTALMWAAIGGNLDVLKELIAHKAEINKAHKGGETALICAAKEGRLNFVQELLNAGSDLLLKTRDKNFESMVLYKFLSKTNIKPTFDRLIDEDNISGLNAIGKLELLKAFKFMDENSDKFDKWIFKEQVTQTKASLEDYKPFNTLLNEVANLDLNTKGDTHKLKDILHKLLSVVKNKEQYGIDVTAYKAKLEKISKKLEASSGKKHGEFIEYVGRAQEEAKTLLERLEKGECEIIEAKNGPLTDYLLSLSEDYTKSHGNLPKYNVNKKFTKDSINMFLSLPKEILASILEKALIANKREADKHIDGADKILCATEIWDDLSTIKSEATELSGLINQAE
jgi:ankyrin repeat protein